MTKKRANFCAIIKQAHDKKYRLPIGSLFKLHYVVKFFETNRCYASSIAFPMSWRIYLLAKVIHSVAA